jgi:hypothetical protein
MVIIHSPFGLKILVNQCIRAPQLALRETYFRASSVEITKGKSTHWK